MDRLIKKCRCIDIKKMFYILLALYLLSIIPLLAAGFYDFPERR
jgi:hypothetical protein